MYSAPSLDKWDGAVAARDRLFAAIEDAKLNNVVSIAGDIHQNWAGELKKDFLNEKSATLGVEFVATSISSNGDGFDINDDYRALLRQQPYTKLFNSQRGYVRHVVTPARWQADFQVLDQRHRSRWQDVDAQELRGGKRQGRVGGRLKPAALIGDLSRVMAGLVPAVHGFDAAEKVRRGCPRQARA